MSSPRLKRADAPFGSRSAGGIGLQLSGRIRINNWDETAFMTLTLLVTVAMLDNLSRLLRMKIIQHQVQAV